MVKESEVSNRLIVESKNDQAFVQALVDYLNLPNIFVSAFESVKVEICKEDYLLSDGVSLASLIGELKTIKSESQKEVIDKIGIILDADDSISEKLITINSALKKVFPLIEEDLFVKPNELKELILEDNQVIQVACHMINVNEVGELENLLREIKTQNSDYADCLESWRSCVEQKDKKITEKEFVKFWVNNYVRFDTCSKSEKKQVKTNCSMECFGNVMKNKLHI